MTTNNTNGQDIRWKQRYENFEKALAVFERMISEIEQVRNTNHEASETQQMALIQSFEMVFELGWKTLGDFLEEQGFTDIGSPRSVIKQAFASGYIVEGEMWLKALLDRNKTTHIYDEKEMSEIVGRIESKYHSLFGALKDFLDAKK